MRIHSLAVLFLTVSGCNVLELSVTKDCLFTEAWYPDADGDGVGEPTSVYVGCHPPEGYVRELDTGDTGGGDSGDSGA